MFAGVLPFWYAALARVRRALHTRLVPRIALFAAFAFVVMMFNIPLPGGSTGHAVGVALLTVVLGPSASVLALSVALVIQALFFGDGGITAIGANCFNMAVVGSFTAFIAYRLVAGRAPLASRRRMVAAALAGYAAINVSALVTAVEFGIQPLLYVDRSGAPLYCPYPLDVTIPAMMIGHLTVAGLAELVLTGGVVAFLQRTDPLLLGRAAGRGVRDDLAGREATRTLAPLWLALGLVLVLTPLGMLAAGTAWGEWSASDFEDAAARQEIAAASLNRTPPARAPAGLARLSGIWPAPIGAYAPRWMRSAALGYALSGMLGAGLVVLTSLGLTTLLRARARTDVAALPAAGRPQSSLPAARSTLSSPAADAASAFSSPANAASPTRSPAGPTRRSPSSAGATGRSPRTRDT